ncbi:MAG: Uma2 family endonuclease [Chloroflexi bacterium]|nr:Uma2 family endonuclease [Chloroflexota bacterium]
MAVNYAPPQARIEYPDSDGEPMAESDFQRDVLMYAVAALSRFFADRPDVYVSGNMFVYYQQGDPESVVAPDVFVVFGVAKRKRYSYRLWEEGGKAPDFVLEVTSSATHAKDQGAKRGVYSFLGVREYFQYDPTADYLEPPLQGLRLSGRNYDAVPTRTLPDGTLVVHSQVLGLELRADKVGGDLRFFDPASKQVLPSYDEAETRAEQEAAARRAAEEEVERLRAELERLKGRD